MKAKLKFFIPLVLLTQLGLISCAESEQNSKVYKNVRYNYIIQKHAYAIYIPQKDTISYYVKPENVYRIKAYIIDDEINDVLKNEFWESPRKLYIYE